MPNRAAKDALLAAFYSAARSRYALVDQYLDTLDEVKRLTGKRPKQGYATKRLRTNPLEHALVLATKRVEGRVPKTTLRIGKMPVVLARVLSEVNRRKAAATAAAQPKHIFHA